jgi:hypothetical protein
MPLPTLLLCASLSATPDVQVTTDQGRIWTEQQRFPGRGSSRRRLSSLLLSSGIAYAHAEPNTPELRQALLLEPVFRDPGFAARAELAYRYRYVSLLGMNLATWDGGRVLHVGNDWVPVSTEAERHAAQAGLTLPPVPITYTVPPAGALLVGAVGVWWLWRKIASRG